MQFIFSDLYYDSSKWDEQKYLNEIKKNISSIDTSLTVETVNIGHGADWPGVLVDLFNVVDWKILTGGSITGLFFLGDRINKNIDAWIAIIDKVSQFISKFKPTRIDEQAALALSLNKIVQKGYKLSSLQLKLLIVPFADSPVQSEIKLEATPDALYIITLKTHDKVYVFGIKSNGKTEFEHEFSTVWCDF